MVMDNDYIEKYENIMNTLIKKSYPSLVSEKIEICEEESKL
jgi:hypothetical protein